MSAPEQARFDGPNSEPYRLTGALSAIGWVLAAVNGSRESDRGFMSSALFGSVCPHWRGSIHGRSERILPRASVAGRFTLLNQPPVGGDCFNSPAHKPSGLPPQAPPLIAAFAYRSSTASVSTEFSLALGRRMRLPACCAPCGCVLCAPTGYQGVRSRVHRGGGGGGPGALFARRAPQHRPGAQTGAVAATCTCPLAHVTRTGIEKETQRHGSHVYVLEPYVPQRGIRVFANARPAGLTRQLADIPVLPLLCLPVPFRVPTSAPFTPMCLSACTRPPVPFRVLRGRVHPRHGLPPTSVPRRSLARRACIQPGFSSARNACIRPGLSARKPCIPPACRAREACILTTPKETR